MGRAPAALIPKQPLGLPSPLAVDFEKPCGAEQIFGVAPDRHQVGEPVQKPDEILDLRDLGLGIHRGLGPLPSRAKISGCSAVRTRSSTLA
jgi:hypothetical protein